MFTGYDDVWFNDAQMYNVKLYVSRKDKNSKYTNTDIVSGMYSTRLHIIRSSDSISYSIQDDKGTAFSVSYTHYIYDPQGNFYSKSQNSRWNFDLDPKYKENIVFTSNLPIFESTEAWKEALQNGDYTGALNYNRVYPIGDWLKDDWSGVLYDPLTGLNTGLDWFNLIRQGLASSALADSTGKSYRNGIRDYFKEANENRDLSNLPYIDSGLSPIYLPSTMPGVSIDPDSDVAVKPGINPEPVSPVEPVPVPDNAKDLNENLNNVAVYVPTLADSLTDMGDGLKNKFPFSIPWDIHYILSGLATTPKAPRFELPLKVERYGIDETIVVDMVRFQVLSDLSRSIFSLLFAMVLINLTIKVIGSFKEE